jgi:hypothetical protein
MALYLELTVAYFDDFGNRLSTAFSVDGVLLRNDQLCLELTPQ